MMPLFAKSTRDRSQGILRNYLLPTFGGFSLRDLTTLSIQRYFTNMATSELTHESRDWRSLRTSHATWLKLAGADVKDAQAQMRHSRASTTLDIYQQFVPESQRQVIDKLSRLSTRIN
jgi:integrase